MILISELIRDDFPSQFVHDELERLIRLAREEISQAQPQDLQLEKLLELFYGEWGFKDTRGVYRLSDALWLDKVLQNRQGSAVSLGAILLWVAGHLDIR
jgi:regulator of sirC expression with transglutaminase-like and TPR domain